MSTTQTPCPQLRWSRVCASRRLGFFDHRDFTEASVGFSWDTPNGALAVRKTGNPTHAASMDPRVKAAVAFAPWGWNASFWDAAGLSGIKTSVFFVAGSVDSTSGYAPGRAQHL